MDRVLKGEGRAPAPLREQAFRNEGGPGPVGVLIGKVAATPVRVADDDFAAATMSGLSDDQLFELVICAAVGRSARLYDAGLAALAEAAADGTAA
ncbi:hypothetical protein ACQPZX_13770 [Actinoplanes sp. CA-142083]|uniref:hypothetical protein n=1 Tax=Actinoplanes sp. CA-142083 TaxID=3239903 RepID=UPI003D8F087E